MHLTRRVGLALAASVVEELGLARQADQDVFIEGRTPAVGMGQLDTLDADWMFFGSLGGVDQAEEFFALAESLDERGAVPEVQAAIPHEGSVCGSEVRGGSASAPRRGRSDVLRGSDRSGTSTTAFCELGLPKFCGVNLTSPPIVATLRSTTVTRVEHSR